MKFEDLQDRIIELGGQKVLLDADVAQIYGVETRDINKSVTNNPDKFPADYVVELSKEEKNKLVENFHRFNNLKHSTVLPKVFPEEGLYMLATILKSKEATNATFIIIETFANIRKLSRNLNAIDENQTEEEQQSLISKSNILLEKIIDIQPETTLKDDETEIETKVELNIGFVKISRVVKTKKLK